MVSVKLRHQLIGGALTVEAAAQTLALSTRSLQRRIAEAGSSFSDILDEVRKVRAGELIAGGGHAMGEIA